MVQIATVGTVQPHITGGPMAVVMYPPLRHPDTGPLVSSVLLDNQELDQGQNIPSEGLHTSIMH